MQANAGRDTRRTLIEQAGSGWRIAQRAISARGIEAGRPKFREEQRSGSSVYESPLPAQAGRAPSLETKKMQAGRGRVIAMSMTGSREELFEAKVGSILRQTT